MNSADLHKRLRGSYPVLDQLPPELLRRVEEEARIVRASEGDVLFRRAVPAPPTRW